MIIIQHLIEKKSDILYFLYALQWNSESILPLVATSEDTIFTFTAGKKRTF